jgi:hypothetical protein
MMFKINSCLKLVLMLAIALLCNTIIVASARAATVVINGRTYLVSTFTVPNAVEVFGSSAGATHGYYKQGDRPVVYSCR